jgi:hypothetical protein
LEKSPGGELRDQSGAAASNAAVTATNARIFSLDYDRDAGVYSFPSLVPGSYQVRAELQGFQPGVRTSTDLQVRQTARADFTLTLRSSA